MEENPSGSLPPAPSLPDQTVRMARVLPLSAVGVTNDQPAGAVRTDYEKAGTVRHVPLEDDPEADPPGWWDAVARDVASSRGGWIKPIVLEPVEDTLLEVAGTDPFVWWARRILYAFAVVAAAGAAITWIWLLVSIVRIVWLELWF